MITTVYVVTVNIPSEVFEQYCYSPMDKEYVGLTIEAAKQAFESSTDMFNECETASFYDLKQAQEYEKKMNDLMVYFSNKLEIE